MARHFFNFFRKLPDDLQFGTGIGAFSSISAIIIMTLLIALESNYYMQVKMTSSVVTDSHQEDLLRVTFNISLPAIPCLYATVDVSDHMGQKFFNVTKNVRKWRLTSDEDGSLRRLGEVNPVAPTYVIHSYDTLEPVSTPLTSSTFDEYMRKYEMVLVNYYAPWCPFCRMLEPVWESVADLLQQRPEYAEQVKLARVDCTKEDSQPLCRKAFIHAFPTILIYLFGSTQTRYMYNGPRTPQALMLFIDVFFQKTHLNLDDGQRLLEGFPDHQAFHQDDISHSNITSHAPEGCQIVGSLNMNRVPGTVSITAQSDGHSFDLSAINMTHIVHHLVFGSPDLLRRGESPNSPAIVANHAPLDSMNFRTENINITIEHYIKIVGVDTTDLGRRKRTYLFSVNTNQYNATGQMPSVRFTHDISPLAIEVRDESMPLHKFLLSLCAIVGGIFTVLGLIDSGLFVAWNSIKKKERLGKLH